ncbi:helix-turn-helix transcriptional regulator [Streptomyces sp. NPDC002574]|uniref:helix-turn-helix transcriptional regulator n=1 Tax=Streptomyces sp. NPDC002574 TaxID=3364652 RepID=UPI00369247EE
MKSERLLSILLLLQTRGRVTAGELAERLEVSVRTIHRDVEALSGAGVPVWAERGRHGGIALLPGYRTDVTGLTLDEARALFVLAGRGAHGDLGLAGALGSALRKVMAALPAPHRPAAALVSERVVVDRTGWMRAPSVGEHLGALQRAVFTDRRLRLRYRRSGETAVRSCTVDPYGLVDKAGTWYLVADHRGKPRLFRVERVASAVVLEAEAVRRPGADLAGEWERLRRRIEERLDGLRVVARVRRDTLDTFVRMNAAHLVGPPPPGDGPWAEVHLEYRTPGAARPLLAFGTTAEVLSPPEVREELARAAAEAAALYASPAGSAA